jgi:hypothetical protein
MVIYIKKLNIQYSHIHRVQIKKKSITQVLHAYVRVHISYIYISEKQWAHAYN